MTQSEEIEKAYHQMAKNFMTPNVIDFTITSNRVIELSKGEGIGGGTIWGVSEFTYDGVSFDKTRRGQMFHGGTEAKSHYNKLVSSLPQDKRYRI